MTTYRVDSAAAAGGDGSTWALAYQTVIAGVAAATQATDIVWVASTHNETGVTSANATYSVVSGVRIISVNKADNTYATGAAVTTANGNNFALNGGTWYGLVLTAGAAVANTGYISLANSDAPQRIIDCTFFTPGTTSVGYYIGNNTNQNTFLRTRNCQFKFGSVGQYVQVRNVMWEDTGSNLDAGSTHPTTLFKPGTNVASDMTFIGSDFSANAGIYFAPSTTVWYVARLIGCTVHATPLANSTIFGSASVDASGEVFLYDTHTPTGDVHYSFAHYSYRGKTVATTDVYITADGAAYDGTNRHSWLVSSTTATVSFPYYSPWIDAYTAGGSAVTPYLECLKNDTVVPGNDGIWAEFMVKTTAGSPRLYRYSDGLATPLTSPVTQANPGVGMAAWHGNSGSDVSFKVDSGGAITPTDIGHVRARVALTMSTGIYVDPKIRGL